ncbi:hypothetical protein COU61_03065, partial [Candidatus Pacearchaeota archaeon CG10_big_fil_rev_8_21_14_0_10_35_13]
QYVKHILKVKYYIRYVDDFVILHNSKEQLEEWKEKISSFLREKLRIELHPEKTNILNLSRGITFLGFRIFPEHMLIRKSNLNKFHRKLEITQALYEESRVSRDKVVEFLEGWMAYANHANTHKYINKLIKRFNKDFSTNNKTRLLSSNKKTANFLRRFDYSKLEYSTQQTYYLLIDKEMKIKEIAIKRGISEATVWKHMSELVRYGQLAIWDLFPKKKIVRILKKIKSPKDSLKVIKARLHDDTPYDKINCVLAHVKFKAKLSEKDKNNSQFHSRQVL